MLIELAALLTALGVIGGAALWCHRFVLRNKRQDRELAAIRKEQGVENGEYIFLRYCRRD